MRKRERERKKKKSGQTCFSVWLSHTLTECCVSGLCVILFLRVGLYSKCWERAGAWLTQLAKRRSLSGNGRVLRTELEVALSCLIQNACPNYCGRSVRRASVVHSIAVKCRTSTEPARQKLGMLAPLLLRGVFFVFFVFFFVLLHARQSNPAGPQGSSEEGGLLIMIIIW